MKVPKDFKPINNKISDYVVKWNDKKIKYFYGIKTIKIKNKKIWLSSILGLNEREYYHPC